MKNETNAIEAKHTAGPWKQARGCGVLSAEDGLVAVVYDGQDYTAELSGERKHFAAVSAANARLIAAAPDLLAACEAFEEWLRREDEGFPNAGEVRKTQEGEAAWRVWWDANVALCAKAQTLARAAISKATGGVA